MSIIEMDSMTQQNAALVEQAAAAAQSLQDQASELAHVVSIFKLVEGEAMHVDAPAAPAALAAAAPVRPARAAPLRVAKPVLKRPAPAAAAKPKKAAATTGNDEWEEF
jgi:methyl-accepting chemotaxis protein